MAAQRTETVELALFATEALGPTTTVGPRPAEQFTATEQPMTQAHATTAAEDERVRAQCTEMARLVNTQTPDYLGLQAGDRIPLSWPGCRHLHTAIVQSTCLWGALVHPEPGHDGIRPCSVMYVRTQLDYGPHAGAWCS
jgi:hypothetical protein